MSLVNVTRVLFKGFLVYLASLSINKDNKLKDMLIVKGFVDVFLENLLIMPPKHDIEFTIYLVPRAVHVCKVSYLMATLSFRISRSSYRV